MPAFWSACGYDLLERGPDGRLVLTDPFLRSYLLRPELAPVPASDAAELSLHQRLLDDPRREVDEQEIARIGDADARENYGIWLRFRQRLLETESIEAAYAGLFAGEGVDVAPLFVHQLTQILLRHILGSEASPLHARAAEMLFRSQKVSVGRTAQSSPPTNRRSSSTRPAASAAWASFWPRSERRREPSSSMCCRWTTRRRTGRATSASISP